MLRHHTPTKQSTATELSTSASNFLNEGLQSKIQATKTKKAKGEKKKNLFLRASITLPQPKVNIKHFIPKSKTPKLFPTPEAQTKNLNDSADKETFTASQAKKKKKLWSPQTKKTLTAPQTNNFRGYEDKENFSAS